MNQKSPLKSTLPVTATTDHLQLAFLARRSQLRPELAKLIAELAFDTRRAA